MFLTARQEGEEMRSGKSIFGVLAKLPLVRLLTLKRHSRLLPTALEARLASSGSADDHLTSAMLYQNKAQELEAEAVEFETAASKISPYEDSKEFRRGALMTAAQEKRHRAKQLQELYSTHLRKAQSEDGAAESDS
jgi:hypothetical protein